MSGANSSDESIERDSDLEEKLKGDSIGDTLYSEKWVLKTLMKLTQVRVTLNLMLCMIQSI